MRIPIREQLGLLVLLTSLIALAVVAIATVIPLIHHPSPQYPTDVSISGSPTTVLLSE